MTFWGVISVDGSEMYLQVEKIVAVVRRDETSLKVYTTTGDIFSIVSTLDQFSKMVGMVTGIERRII